ncbi:MAG: cation diffusion facilitator family transporter [Acidimicrobiia bacterium]
MSHQPHDHPHESHDHPDEDAHRHAPDDHGHNHPHEVGHDHPHDHANGGPWAAARHVVGEIFGGHSHDSADSVDAALESSERGIRALKLSFLVLMVTAVVQTIVVILTGSVALLADTIHNFSDALTSVPLFVAFKMGRRAANRQYTYGYRRAEDLAGLFVVLMILVSAILAAWQSIDRLINPREIAYLGVVFAAGVIGFIGNELVAIYRIRVGEQIGSAALVADGRHARVDGFTSLAVAAGAAGVWLGFERADPIVGVLVSIAILGVLRTAARDIYRRLMDAVDVDLVDRIEAIARGVVGVREIGRCQVRWMGHRLRVDLELEVDGALSVAGGHKIAEDSRLALLAGIVHLDDVHVHIDPTGVHALESKDGVGTVASL